MNNTTNPLCHKCHKHPSYHSVTKNWGGEIGLEQRYLCCECYTDYVNMLIKDIDRNYELRPKLEDDNN